MCNSPTLSPVLDLLWDVLATGHNTDSLTSASSLLASAGWKLLS